MKKQQGYGTVGIQFNLDPQSRYENYEQYQANKDQHIPLFDNWVCVTFHVIMRKYHDYGFNFY